MSDLNIRECVKDICIKHAGETTGHVLSILSDILEEFRYVPVESFEIISEQTGASIKVLERICERGDMFDTEPVGKHLIIVCDGTVCHTRGAIELQQALEFALGIQAGQTSADGRYTLRCVNCMGDCSQAPLMTIDGEISKQVRLADVSKTLDALT